MTAERSEVWPAADLRWLRDRLGAAITRDTNAAVDSVLEILAVECGLKLTAAAPTRTDTCDYAAPPPVVGPERADDLRAERDAALAQAARFRQGAADVPAQGTEATPGQLWAWLLASTPERRLSWLEAALLNAREAGACHTFQHGHQIDDLRSLRDRLLRELDEARDAIIRRLDVTGIEPGKTYVIRMPDVTRLDELDRITDIMRALWPSGAHIAVLAPGATLETSAQPADARAVLHAMADEIERIAGGPDNRIPVGGVLDIIRRYADAQDDRTGATT